MLGPVPTAALNRITAACKGSAGVLTLGLLIGSVATGWIPDSAPGVSKAAAAQCQAKVAGLESFASKTAPGRKQTTQITEDEINSYLALDLSAKYNPCLKSLALTIQEGGVRGEASIDFDVLGLNATKLLTRLMASMFTGTHKLNARGEITAQNGKASFRLESARFDNTTLPNFLVEEIITAVGRKQKPPIDPLQPSQMPFRIEKVDLHPGYIVIYQ